MFPHYLAKVRSLKKCGNFQKKQSKNRVTLTKTEMPLVVWLNIVTTVDRSIRLLPARMR